GILLGEANGSEEKVILTTIPHAKFHREAMPGEMLTYTTEILNLAPEGAVIKGRVTSGDDLIAEAEIFFAHLDQNRSAAIFGDHNFVFSGELKYLFEGVKIIEVVSGAY